MHSHLFACAYHERQFNRVAHLTDTHGVLRTCRRERVLSLETLHMGKKIKKMSNLIIQPERRRLLDLHRHPRHHPHPQPGKSTKQQHPPALPAFSRSHDPS